jgi:hypothetical protein
VLDADVMLVRDLWMATRGGAEGFLFKDPRDYTADGAADHRRPPLSALHDRRQDV